MSRRITIRARVWSALLLPPVTWFVFEQGLSALLHAHCDNAAVGIAWGVMSLIVCIFAAWLAWQLKAQEGDLPNPWLARLALAMAGIFALAVLFQTLALSMVPPCVA